jgi:hypothetical protein
VPRFRTLACVASLCGVSGLSATAQEPHVVVQDLTPKFVAFYDSATAHPTTSDERWALWTKLDGFAAVPPTPFGQQLARRLLDSAWTRYPSAIERIRHGAGALPASPDSLLRQVVALLGCGQDLRVRLVLFVGGFDENAFAYTSADGLPTIAVPVEAGDAVRALVHEFTHAAHRSACTTFHSSYKQSLAELTITEGLAMRVVERLIPSHDAAYYIIGAPSWLSAAESRRSAIVRGIQAHMLEDSVSTVERFTFGTGTTGLGREAYYGGWEIVGALLRDGMSFHDIATTPPEQFPRLIDRAVAKLTPN